MNKDQLTAISPIDGRYGEQTSQLKSIFSEYGLMRYRLLVEIEWFIHLSNQSSINELPKLSANMKKNIFKIHKNFSLQEANKVKRIEAKTNHDVKAIEYYLKDAISLFPSLKKYREFIHFGCTSEDINNIAYGLMIRDASKKIFEVKYKEFANQLRNKAHKYASVAMISRTHGQIATPTTLGKEFANFLFRIEKILEVLEKIHIRGKINGAVGNYNAHLIAYPKANWEKISESFVTTLGLSWAPYTTQVEPKDSLSKLFHSYQRLNNVLIDFSRDIWGYISLGYFSQKTKQNEIGSSTMPHKINPIDFENAEGNLGISNAYFSHLTSTMNISRWQRDLSDSTLMRNIGTTLGHSLIALNSLNKGLTKLKVNRLNINNDLHMSYEVITEAVQTIMRKYGIDGGYELMKKISRGKKITKENLKQLIDELDIPEKEKKKLRNLSPANYIGLAEKFAKKS